MEDRSARPGRREITGDDVRALATALDIRLLDGEAEQIAPELGIALALARRLQQRNQFAPSAQVRP